MRRNGLAFQFLFPVLSVLGLVSSGVIYGVTEAQTRHTERVFEENLTSLAVASRSMVHSDADEYCRSKGMAFHRIQPGRQGAGEAGAFEAEAFRAFEGDPKLESLTHRFTDGEGKPQLYVLAPARLRDACITCHSGYGLETFKGMREGQLTGAFGVSISMQALQDAEQRSRLIAALGGVGLLVLVGLVIRHFVRRTILKPLAGLSGAIHQMARGDMDIPAFEARQDEMGELQASVQALASSIQAMGHETDGLIAAATAGRLEVRAAEGSHQGQFLRVLKGFNQTLDAVTGPLCMVAGHLDRMSRGDVPPAITEPWQGEFLTLRDSLNTCAEAVRSLVEDVKGLNAAALEGNLGQRANAARHEGDFRRIVQGVNDTLDAMTGPLRTAAGHLDRMSRGDIPPDLEEDWRGEFRTLRDGLNICAGAVRSLVGDVRALAAAAQAGDLERRAEGGRHQGDFFRIVEGINGTLEAVVTPLREVIRVLGALERGDLTAGIPGTYQGQLQVLCQAVNATVEQLHATVGEIRQGTGVLASSAEELNATSTTMASTAQASTRQADSAALGTREASASIHAMAAGIEQISANATTVASATEEVSANLRTVGGATTQMSGRMQVIADASGRVDAAVRGVASAIEEMSASLAEVSRSSTQAAQVAGVASQTAEGTSAIISQLGVAAQEVGKVVDLIQGIAAQTNLLALNATIEAASAGEAGKGFAVVASEVKALAKQTAAATEDIRAQITGIQACTGQAVSAIDEIVGIIQQIDGISGAIAAAVEEQTATTREIRRSVGEAAEGAGDMARTVHEVAQGAREVSLNVQEAVLGVGDISRNIAQLAQGAGEVARNAGTASRGMQEVAQSVAAVSQATGDTTRGATDTLAAAQELGRLADRLKAAVDTFKTR